MSAIYRVLIFGDEATGLPPAARAALTGLASEFAVEEGRELQFVLGADAKPEAVASVAFFIAAVPPPPPPPDWVLASGIPIIPIVSDIDACLKELPAELSKLNAVALNQPAFADAIATVALECLGLLHRQRRVFLSYARRETRDAAVQLYDSISARQFDVFLDTHDVRPGEVFQAVLWHRLCDSDVMVMLDSAGYFSRRWTREEFGKANHRKLAILRVGWPGVTPSGSLSITENLQLTEADFAGDVLTPSALDRIGDRIESLRARSIATRHANLAGTIAAAIDDLKGKVVGIGARRSIEIELPRGKRILAYPALGVPSAETLNDVALHAASTSAAIVYDAVGVHDRWLAHLTWLGEKIPIVRWIRSADIGWDLTAWDSE